MNDMLGKCRRNIDIATAALRVANEETDEFKHHFIYFILICSSFELKLFYFGGTRAIEHQFLDL